MGANKWQPEIGGQESAANNGRSRGCSLLTAYSPPAVCRPLLDNNEWPTMCGQSAANSKWPTKNNRVAAHH